MEGNCKMQQLTIGFHCLISGPVLLSTRAECEMVKLVLQDLNATLLFYLQWLKLGNATEEHSTLFVSGCSGILLKEVKS